MSELQTVIFSLNGQFFGVEATQVFQIIRYEEPTKIPRMPRFLEGMMNYRNAVLPIISLSKRFELGETEVTKKTKVLVTKINEKLAGFIVSDVSEIIKFTDAEIEPAPSIVNTDASAYLKMVGKKEDRLISIIDLSRVLTDNEVKRIKN